MKEAQPNPTQPKAMAASSPAASLPCSCCRTNQCCTAMLKFRYRSNTSHGGGDEMLSGKIPVNSGFPYFYLPSTGDTEYLHANTRSITASLYTHVALTHWVSFLRKLHFTPVVFYVWTHHFTPVLQYRDVLRNDGHMLM